MDEQKRVSLFLDRSSAAQLEWACAHTASLPEIEFTLLLIGAGEGLLPPFSRNVTICLPTPTAPERNLGSSSGTRGRVLHSIAPSLLRLGHGFDAEDLRTICHTVREEAGRPLSSLLDADDGWDIIRAVYDRYGAGGANFVAFASAARASLSMLFDAARAAVPYAELVHAASDGPAGLYAAAASFRWGAPLLVTVTEGGDRSWNRNKGGEPSLEAFTREVNAGWIRAVSNTCRLVVLPYREGGPAWVHRVRSRIIRSAAPRPVPPVPHHSDPDSITIATVGPTDGLETALWGFSTVAASRDTVRLLVGSDELVGAEMERARSIATALGIGDLVSFLTEEGALARANVAVATAPGGAAIQPLLRAGAGGIPLLAPNLPGYRELVEGALEEADQGGRGGRLYHPTNPASLAAALEELLDPVTRSGCGEAIYDRVVEHYGEERYRHEYRALYHSFVALPSLVSPLAPFREDPPHA